MASKSCKEFLTVKSRTVFKLFRHRVNASSNSATVTFFTVFKMCQHCVNAVLVCTFHSFVWHSSLQAPSVPDAGMCIKTISIPDGNRTILA